MTIRNWLFLFVTTLALGGVAALLIGFLLELFMGEMDSTCLSGCSPVCFSARWRRWAFLPT